MYPNSMFEGCYCPDYYPHFLVNDSCSGWTITTLSQQVILANNTSTLCTNIPLYGYNWTVHGAVQSGNGWCGQLSYSESWNLDQQLYWCINVQNSAITSITNNPTKNSSKGWSVNLNSSQINSALQQQGASTLSSSQLASQVILASFAQAAANLYGYTL